MQKKKIIVVEIDVNSCYWSFETCCILLYKRKFKIFFAENAQDAHTEEKKLVICLLIRVAFIRYLVY